MLALAVMRLTVQVRECFGAKLLEGRNNYIQSICDSDVIIGHG